MIVIRIKHNTNFTKSERSYADLAVGVYLPHKAQNHQINRWFCTKKYFLLAGSEHPADFQCRHIEIEVAAFHADKFPGVSCPGK